MNCPTVFLHPTTPLCPFRLVLFHSGEATALPPQNGHGKSLRLVDLRFFIAPVCPPALCAIHEAVPPLCIFYHRAHLGGHARGPGRLLLDRLRGAGCPAGRPECRSCSGLTSPAPARAEAGASMPGIQSSMPGSSIPSPGQWTSSDSNPADGLCSGALRKKTRPGLNPSRKLK